MDRQTKCVQDVGKMENNTLLDVVVQLKSCLIKYSQAIYVFAQEMSCVKTENKKSKIIANRKQEKNLAMQEKRQPVKIKRKVSKGKLEQAGFGSGEDRKLSMKNI